MTEAYKVNKNIKFEVFIHKVDGLSDDHKIGTLASPLTALNDCHTAIDSSGGLW